MAGAFARQADPEPVRRAAASAQASVRQRAAALLNLLGTGEAASAPPAAQPSPVGDLMGGMDEAAPAAAAQPSTQDLLGTPLCTFTTLHCVSSTSSKWAPCFRIRHQAPCLFLDQQQLICGRVSGNLLFSSHTSCWESVSADVQGCHG